MVHAMGPNSLITCPLDESHQILKSRMQFHLVRCSKNHKLGMKLKCPWNPLHIIDKFAYEDHYLRQCEDMPGALEFMCQSDEHRDVGSVPVTATNGLMPPSEEDWDADPAPVGTYDPLKSAEGRPVLRIAVGLSKAKKKAWRQAERKRFQMLEENGPIQIKSRPPEKPVVPKVSGPPSKLESDSSNLSGDDKRTRAASPQTLRTPHEPSSALTYKANIPNTKTGALRKRIPLGSEISADDESHVFDELPNLCQLSSNSFHDTASRRSSISSRNSIDAIRKTLEKSLSITNTSSTMHCVSEAENSGLVDEAASVLKLIAPIAETEEDIVVLSQQLAELTMKQKNIDEMKRLLMQKMARYEQLPKLISSTASHTSFDMHDRKSNDEKFNGSISVQEDALPAKQQNSFLNGIPKCAANFSKLTRNANPPTVGVGRGMVISLDSFKNCQPSPRNEEIAVGMNTAQYSTNKENTKPFPMPETMIGGNTSHRTYSLNAANADDDDSVYGYEEAD